MKCRSNISTPNRAPQALCYMQRVLKGFFSKDTGLLSDSADLMLLVFA
jgi:hypothetical protein